jgi:hypothetical protein
MKAVLKATWAVLTSPQARRYEYALALLVYEGIRASLGHA